MPAPPCSWRLPTARPRPVTATRRSSCRRASTPSTSRSARAATSETIAVKAGETVEKDIVVGVGHLVMNAFYTAGGDRVEATGVCFQVVKAEKSIDGSREALLTNYGPDSKADLPGGDYVVDRENGRGERRGARHHHGRRQVGRQCHARRRRARHLRAGRLQHRDRRREEGHPGRPQILRRRLWRDAPDDPAGRRLCRGGRARRRAREDRSRRTVKAGERSEVAVP